MIDEIQKRPFVRPLVLWIMGILLSLLFTTSFLVGCFMVLSVLLLSFSFGRGKRSFYLPYSSRWVWGFVFSCLILALSVVVADYTSRARAAEYVPGPVEETALRIQEGFVEELNTLRLSQEEKSVLATLTLGYRKAMNREMRRRFSLTGVSHILSVSGFHVAVVCGFLSFFFGLLPRGRVNRWVKYIAVMGLLWCFVLITGLGLPSVRAGLMYSLYLTGNTFGRTGDRYNTLAAAAFCMLAYDPYSLFDIGFQLSYIAVFFILYLQPRLRGMIDVRNPVVAYPWGVVTVTLAAQIGTTVLCLYYFGQFSLVFLFTNLPLALISTLLIPSALLWVLLPAGFPGIGWLQLSVEYLTRTMVRIVDMFSLLPGAAFQFRFDLLSVCISYGALFFFLLYFRKKRPWMLLTGLSLILLLLSQYLIERMMA